MQIVLSDGESIDVEQVQDDRGDNILGIWDGVDANGLKVRFIRYREKPNELLLIRYPSTKFGAFTKSGKG